MLTVPERNEVRRILIEARSKLKQIYKAMDRENDNERWLFLATKAAGIRAAMDGLKAKLREEV